MCQILIRAPKELKTFIVNEAKRIGISANALILQILWEWLRKNEQEDQKKETVNG